MTARRCGAWTRRRNGSENLASLLFYSVSPGCHPKGGGGGGYKGKSTFGVHRLNYVLEFHLARDKDNSFCSVFSVSLSVELYVGTQA